MSKDIHNPLADIFEGFKYKLYLKRVFDFWCSFKIVITCSFAHSWWQKCMFNKGVSNSQMKTILK